jgi:predicted DNA-binding mobile mystery protein A
MSSDASLAIKNLDRRFAAIKAARIETPPRGWIRAVREALGMSTRQLAARMGAAPSRISTLEKAETTGRTTLRSLREAAEAMDCTLVYALVPNTSLESILRRRASDLANEEISRIHHTMRLENQAVGGADLDAQRQRLIDALLSGPPRRLWDKP